MPGAAAQSCLLGMPRKGHAADIVVRRDLLMHAGWMGTDHKPDIVEPDVLRQRNSRMKVCGFCVALVVLV